MTLGIMDWLGNRAEAANIGFAKKFFIEQKKRTSDSAYMSEIAQWMGSDGFDLLVQTKHLNQFQLAETADQTLRTSDSLTKMDPTSGSALKLISQYAFLKACTHSTDSANAAKAEELTQYYISFFEEIRLHLLDMMERGQFVDQTELNGEIDKWILRS